ncbi:MAG: glycoside hydrolase family 3 C-terminal domain-containing protein [Acidobacteriota bacterium]
MRPSRSTCMRGFAICAATLLLTPLLSAQTAQKSTPAYLNPQLPPTVRARDLVSRLTLQEKASQMVNGARAIPRLGIPAYNWWSEALHGVQVNGSTEFPEPIGLGATFDPAAIHEMATDISLEARVLHQQQLEHGGPRFLHGLDFWAPNINIVRDPRWGRGQETYGEDPFLTAQMGVAYVTGMQGNDPRYYRVISTPKHFDAYSGPEPTRHFADVDVSRHDLEDTYLPAFRAAIVQGHAGSVMCSYNAVNGEPACANQFLLQDELRDHWGFHGYVVSDCGAVRDIFTGHHYRPTQPQATAISVERGMDNECAESNQPAGDKDYQAYIQAVQQGYLSQTALDEALVRLFTARIELGLFAPKGADPYANINADELNSPAHHAYARKVADESMVLLKNDGTLPLKPTVHNIAVIGPLADQTNILLGNYAGIPTHIVSVLEGIKNEFPHVKITYVAGTQFLNNNAGKLIPAGALTTASGKPGLEAQYQDYEGRRPGPGVQPKNQLSRVDPGVDLPANSLPAALAGKKMLRVQWTGFLTPAQDGTYLIGFKASGYATIDVNGRRIAEQHRGDGELAVFGRVPLEKNQKVSITVDYRQPAEGAPMVQLLWAPAENAPSPAAVAAAKQADVVIAVVGLTSQLEGEEMPVDLPGFLGGDKTDLKMPEPEEALVQSVAATGKPLVVVLLNGSALAVNWLDRHANAILEAWYPGEEGGSAVADTLSGRNNPAGRLPETFYASVHQLPNFESFSMQGRTYRYFTGKPLYPFGYGLSYTTFRYSALAIAHPTVNAGDPVDASVTVTNTGKVAGDEVAQLYLKFPPVAGAPNIALRGFQRIHLLPGQSQRVRFELKERDLGMVTALGQPIIAAGEYTMSIGGGQPGTVAPVVTGHFAINGQIDLPE